jgi:RHS repeat-associated protein
MNTKPFIFNTAALAIGLLAISANAHAQTWSTVAAEGAAISISGTQTVRFGKGVTFVQKSVVSTGQCTATFFGSDPAPGVVKQCDQLIASPPANQTWNSIAVEGAAVIVTGTQTVRFGVGTSWIQRSITSTGQCTAAFFGNDPAPGVLKQCDLLVTAAQGVLPAPPISPPVVINYQYDANGNQTRVTQAPGGLNLTTQTAYDTLNRAKSVTDAAAGVTQFTYDGQDRTTQVTDPRGLQTKSPRNGLGGVTQLISPDTGTTANTYDVMGRVKTRTDARGVLSTYTYDLEKRLTAVVHSQTGKPSETFSWGYDQVGAAYSNGINRLTSINSPAASSQYMHNAWGEVLKDTQFFKAATGANATQISRAVIYTYSAAGQLTNITYPSGRKLTLTYPPQSDLINAISLAKDATSTPVPLISNIVWEPFGPPSAWDWNLTAGPQKYERIYDLAGRITRLPLGNVIRDISYDAASRISAYTHYDAITSAPQPALNQSFGYDALGRITSVSANASSWSFAYDANGNRTSVAQNGVASSYTNATTSNRLNAISNPANSVAYDAAGNTITTSQYSATHDLSGRMASLTKGGITTTYSYNNAGQRTRKFSSSGATSTVLFVYGQDGNLLGEYDATGKPIKEYVWFQNIPIAVFTPDPAAAANPPLVYFIHSDHLNTPRAVVDKANKPRWRWMAEPFGVSAPETNPSNLGAFTFNLRFPGQYFDQESALHQNWWRSYDPTTGRYTQSDPIGLAGGINTFAYVDSNPTGFIDPFGLTGYTTEDAWCRQNPVACAEIIRPKPIPIPIPISPPCPPEKCDPLEGTICSEYHEKGTPHSVSDSDGNRLDPQVPHVHTWQMNKSPTGCFWNKKKSWRDTFSNFTPLRARACSSYPSWVSQEGK